VAGRPVDAPADRDQRPDATVTGDGKRARAGRGKRGWPVGRDARRAPTRIVGIERYPHAALILGAEHVRPDPGPALHGRRAVVELPDEGARLGIVRVERGDQPEQRLLDVLPRHRPKIDRNLAGAAGDAGDLTRRADPVNDQRVSVAVWRVVLQSRVDVERCEGNAAKTQELHSRPAMSRSMNWRGSFATTVTGALMLMTRPADPARSCSARRVAVAGVMSAP